jgi:hypothetical protein
VTVVQNHGAGQPLYVSRFGCALAPLLAFVQLSFFLRGKVKTVAPPLDRSSHEFRHSIDGEGERELAFLGSACWTFLC